MKNENGSTHDPKGKIIADLANGKRDPQNDYEKKLLEQIKVIEAEGKMLEIPNEFV